MQTDRREKGYRNATQMGDIRRTEQPDMISDKMTQETRQDDARQKQDK